MIDSKGSCYEKWNLNNGKIEWASFSDLSYDSTGLANVNLGLSFETCDYERMKE